MSAVLGTVISLVLKPRAFIQLERYKSFDGRCRLRAQDWGVENGITARALCVQFGLGDKIEGQ